jgi:DNA polymerase-3 subunit gamma/tau
MEERLLSEVATLSPSAIEQPASPLILQAGGQPDNRLTTGREELEPLTPAESAKGLGRVEQKVTEGSPTGIPEELDGVWKEFVHFAKKKKPPFASLLEHGYPLALEKDLLQIGYPEKSFYLERMEEADNRSLLGTLGSEFFKRAVRVKVVALKSDAVPRGNRLNDEKDRKKNSRDDKEEALNHPLVQEAISIFGGRVVEIKDL